VRFQPRPLGVVAIVGPQAGAVLERTGAVLPPDTREAHVQTTVGGRAARVVRAGDLPGSGHVLHVAEGDADAVVEALRAKGAARLEPEALHALRVEAGRPWYGRDVGPENLLHETGLVAECCSFQKGCYLGQEVVARLDARGGNVNKRLRGLRLQATAAEGDPVFADMKPVGAVTTAALSPRLGPIALGYLHRSHADAGVEVSVGGHPACVADLPLSDDLARTA
jgi:folate-binding protein YgfZ